MGIFINVVIKRNSLTFSAQFRLEIIENRDCVRDS